MTISSEDLSLATSLYPHHPSTYHYAPPNDGVLSTEGNLSVHYVQGHLPSCIGSHVAQVPSMSVLVRGTSMLFLRGVEVSPGTDAASGVVPKLVDVEAVLTLLQPGHLPSHPRLPIILHMHTQKYVECK